MRRNSKEWPVACLSSENEVFARQNNLQKILVIQKAVTVIIIEINQFLAVSLSKLINLIIPKKTLNVLPINILLGSPIDSHESTVGCEIWITSTEDLPEIF
jgi:hypothetical protein